MNSFVKQFVASIKGDEAEVKALKAWRKAESSLQVEIALLKGKTVDLESKVDDAKESLEKARINSGNIIGTDYINNLKIAKNNLSKAELELSNHKKELVFLEEEYANLSKEVE